MWEPGHGCGWSSKCEEFLLWGRRLQFRDGLLEDGVYEVIAAGSGLYR